MGRLALLGCAQKGVVLRGVVTFHSPAGGGTGRCLFCCHLFAVMAHETRQQPGLSCALQEVRFVVGRAAQSEALSQAMRSKGSKTAAAVQQGVHLAGVVKLHALQGLVLDLQQHAQAQRTVQDSAEA